MRAIILTVLLLGGCSGNATFDMAKWRNADLNGRARADMLPDFIQRYGLKGMSRQQVVSLLGHPTLTDKWRDADMIYVLGNDGSMFPIDNGWLFIKLDRSGRVASFTQGAD